MRILSARIFSKSFGGKITHGQTDVNKEITFKKKNYMTLACKLGFYLVINFYPKFRFHRINIVLIMYHRFENNKKL